VNGPHGALAVSLAQAGEHPVPGLTLAMATFNVKLPFADKTQDTALGALGLIAPPAAEVDFRPGVGCTSVERKNLKKKHSKCEVVHDDKVHLHLRLVHTSKSAMYNTFNKISSFSRQCNTFPGVYQDPGPWSDCSTSCPGGQRVRTSVHTCGRPSKRDVEACGGPGGYLPWGTWSACSSSCSGVQVSEATR